ncbi:MAG: hypothetical protein SF123_10075 [Chloroflexota bacterium]|nr:hypothetical protein [Chloroflexota bacterium]
MKRYVVLVAIYSLLALLWLRQPLMHIETHMTGDPGQPVTTDYYHFHWNYWWIRHALTNGLDVYQTNYVFAPHTSNLSLHTLAPLWYPIWAALEPAFGTVASMAGVFFVALLLNGFVFHVFLEKLGTAPGLALVGGILLQGSEVIFISLKWTMTNLLGWFWLPLVLLVWEGVSYQASGTGHQSSEKGKGTRAKGKMQATVRLLWWSLLLGVTLWAMILTDLQYGVFLAFLLPPLVGWSLIDALKNKANVMADAAGRGLGIASAVRLLASATLALMVALLLLWVVGPLQPLLEFEQSVLATTPADRAPHVEFPLGLFWRDGHGASYGVLPVLLVITAIGYCLRHRGVDLQRIHRGKFRTTPPWVWLVLALPPLALSLGATVSLLGVDLPMPYQWFHMLLGGNFRYPERFINVFMIPALAFALPLLSNVFARARTTRMPFVRFGFVVLVLVALLDVEIFGSVPLQAAPPQYKFYEQMGREAADYVVVEVPTAGASGEGIVGRSEWAALQYYGIAHQHRMINGHISRVDPLRYLYMEFDDPMLAWLGQRRWLEPDIVHAQMQERISAFPVGYFVIHIPFLPQNGSTLQEVLGFFNQNTDLVCPTWASDSAVVYRTTWHPAGCPARIPIEVDDGIEALPKYEILIGSPDDQRFIGWGWHWREQGIDGGWYRWAGDYPRLGGDVVPEDGFLHADLHFDLPSGAYQLELMMDAYGEARQVTLSLNDTVIGSREVSAGQGVLPYVFELPREVLGDGHNLTLRIAYDNALIPDSTVGTSQARRLSVLVTRVRFTRIQ